jgi:hypothetical protein
MIFDVFFFISFVYIVTLKATFCLIKASIHKVIKHKSMRLRVISKLVITLFMLLILFYGCRKYDHYPIIPHIELNSFQKSSDSLGVDQIGVIGLSFTDGDGDLGLTADQNTGVYQFNLFIKYFEKQKGVFKEIILTTPNTQTGKPDTLWFNGRIPYITPAGKTKAISGEITDTLFINNFASPYDTIKYQIYIQDRALNKSNVVETPEIVINKKPRKP